MTKAQKLYSSYSDIIYYKTQIILITLINCFLNHLV